MTARFIAGDWGTSRLRLYLCDSAGTVLDTRAGPGVANLDRKLAKTFASLVAEWDAKCGVLPAVLCGMSGSTLGWRDVPYIACPARPQAIADGTLTFTETSRRVALAPGLSCRNPLGAPDVMRGEETQILGALRIDGSLAHGLRFLCLPGTHTKWVLLRDGVIESFLTGFTGELFDILRTQSVLAREAALAIAMAPFRTALDQVAAHADAELIHMLFETRARQLAGELSAQHAASYLSGLIIGHDAAGATRLFADAATDRIVLIGTNDLCDLYAAAFEARGLATRFIDGAAASLAGLTALHEALFAPGLADAS